MAIFKTVGTLAQGAVSTAASVARHPVNTASQAADLVKGTAGAGVGLVRNRIPGGAAKRSGDEAERTGQSPAPAEPVVQKVAEPVKKAAEKAAEPVREAAERVAEPVKKAAEPAAKKAAEVAQDVAEPVEKTAAKKTPAKKPAKKTPAKATAKKAAKKPTEDPRDKIPGPELAKFEPPAPEDLPEPVVIVAEDEPGEAFQTEPKAAPGKSARSGAAYTAESDLQQPGTPPLLDPATAKAVKSESEVLRKAADNDRG